MKRTLDDPSHSAKRRATPGGDLAPVERSPPLWGHVCAQQCQQRAACFAAASVVMEQTEQRNTLRRTLDKRYADARLAQGLDHVSKEAVRFDREARAMHASLLEARQTIQTMQTEYARLKAQYDQLVHLVRNHVCTNVVAGDAPLPYIQSR